jgi:diguanylate cyclase (GGDEF)-like protein
VVNKKPLGWIVVIQDITESAHHLKSLEEEAYTDPLTHLANRRYFMKLAQLNFQKSRRAGEPCYALMFDIDFFKKVNDTYGHPAGDAVLVHLADTVRRVLRTYDTVARYGGEEFILMVSGISEEHIVHLAERLRKKVEDTVCVFGGDKIRITISIGIASTEGAADLTELVCHTDSALYYAKENGRNQVQVYKEGMAQAQ